MKIESKKKKTAEAGTCEGVWVTAGASTCVLSKIVAPRAGADTTKGPASAG
jgi:hypothetical protein